MRNTGGGGGPVARRLSEPSIDALVAAQQQLLSSISEIEYKIDAICEAVSAKAALRKSMPTIGTASPHHSSALGLDSCASEHLPPCELSMENLVDKSNSNLGMDSVALAAFDGSQRQPFVRMRPGAVSVNVNVQCNTSTTVATRCSRRASPHPTPAESDLSSKETASRWSAWNPDSLSRTVFDILSMLVLMHDAFMVPYLLAWQVPVEGPSMWCSRIFWTIDLGLNLVTGYRGKDSALVLEPWKAMKHYVYRWFLADFLLVAFDWLAVTSWDQSWLPRIRVVRLVRGGRQVLRGWKLVLKAKVQIYSKTFHLLLELSLFIIIIVWVNHCFCCGWYSIGLMASDTGETWLSAQELSGSSDYVYWTALHWAMTQMTPGSMEVTPRSTSERIYNVCVLLLGLLMGTSLIATLTSMLTQYKLRVEGSSQKFMVLQQFLTQQGVDQNLALAIKLQVKARSSEGQRLRAQDVEYLSLLSNSMQDKLWYNLSMRHLSQHHFLNGLCHVDPLVMKSVCKSAVSTLEFAADDAVFEEGSSGNRMYFVVFGQFLYKSCQTPILCDSPPDLGPGSWCSEAALWTVWTHMGTLEAASSAEVLTLSGPRFLSAVANFPVTAEIVADYCQAFYRHINTPGGIRSDLPDLLDHCDLISTLSPENRLHLSWPHMERLETRTFWDQIAHAELLRDEVDNGCCDVGMVNGEVMRLTAALALRIYEYEGCPDRFLVKVGEVSKGGTEARCEAPSTTRGWRESYEKSFARLLEHDFEAVAPFISVNYDEGCQQTVSVSDTPGYGMRTRATQTTFTATLSSNAPLQFPLLPSRLKSERAGFTALLRYESRREAQEQQTVASVLSNQQSLIAIDHPGESPYQSLHLWLTEQELALLSKEAARPCLEKWLASVPYFSAEAEPAPGPSFLEL